jgi:hypothetical protein
MDILKVSRENNRLVTIVLTEVPMEKKWLGNYLRDSLIEFGMGDLEIDGPEKEGTLFIITFDVKAIDEKPSSENIFVVIGKLLFSAELIVQKKVFEYLESSDEYSDTVKSALKYYLSYN